jgi:hypothetical protein
MGKVSLFLADVLGDFLVPFVSPCSTKIHIWNMLVEDYVVFVFDFVDKFLASDGAIFVFHLNDFHVLKEIISYLESYSF